MDIIIFGGQSNMQGQSDMLTDALTVKNAFEYRFLENRLKPLSNPVGEDIRYDGEPGEPVTRETSVGQWLKKHVAGGACYRHTNLVPKFCESYVEETGRQVTAVHVAKGSTEIKEWIPGTDGYGILVKKSLAAIQKVKQQYEIGHIFFVWLQGESDAIARNTKSYYKEKLTLLNKALKEDVGIHKFGVIRVGRFTKDERDLEIIGAQDEICEENQDFIMLTRIATELNKQSQYMNPFVGGHYSARGLEVLGLEAGKTLGTITTKEKGVV